MRHLGPIAAAVALVAGLTIVALGEPSVEARIAAQREALTPRLRNRAVHVDPWELYLARWNARLKIHLIDLRGESDYNLFHLRGAQRVPLEHLTPRWPKAGGAVVLYSNDEALAEAAWLRLTALGQPNAYVLAGGVNLWLDLFRPRPGDPPGGLPPKDRLNDDSPSTADTLRHRFDSARGSAWPFAFPPRPAADQPRRAFTPVLRVEGAGAKEGGGCG